MISQITVPDEACRYILFQRTAYQHFPRTRLFKILSVLLPFINRDRTLRIEANIRSAAIKALYAEDMYREYLSIENQLPKKCSTILDVGCGVAGIDVFLSRHYSNEQPDIYLLDRTYIETRVFYRFHSKAAFYNSLDVAKRLLVANGVPSTKVHLLEATDNGDTKIEGKVDLIVSLISWGFHYPVSTYLEKAYEILNSNGVVILDIRKGTDGLEALQRKFSKTKIISEEPKYSRVIAAK